MKNLFLILAITFLFVGCKDSEDRIPEQDAFIYRLHADFSIVNSKNADLLNPETPGHLNIADFRVYYLINGEKKLFYKPDYDYPYGYLYNDELREGKTSVRIFFNSSETEDRPITYVQWSNQDTDTIQVEYERTINGVIQKNIWLNGEHIWDRKDDKLEYFTLTK